MSELFPAKQIAIEILSCTDATREWEFNRWYDKVRIPNLRKISGIVDVYRYRDMLPKYTGGFGAAYVAPEGMPVRYVTLYRINTVDPWGLMQQIKQDDERETGKGTVMDIIKTHELTVWEFNAYRRSIAPPQRPETHLPDGMPEAVLLVFNSSRPGKNFEHDDWWQYTHSHDLLETPGMVQTERYRNLNPKMSEQDPTCLNIYEIDSPDPVAVCQRVFEDDKNIRRPQGRFSGFNLKAESFGPGLYQHWDPT